MRKFILSFVLLLVAAVALDGNPPSYAQGMEGSVLFVAPHRLIITPGERSETISVSNKSSEARRYDLTLVDQVMNEQGVTQRVDNAPYSVKKMVEYKPARFTLKPGDSQVVRVLVTRPDNLPDGDYHSHLLFREVPLSRKDEEAAPKQASTNDKTVTFEIRTLYGLGVPIIVQQGKIAADISTGDVALGKEDGKPALTVVFNRSGNAEAAGKFSVQYLQAGKKPVDAIDPQWVRMYREVNKVTKHFPLSLPEGASGGKLVLSLARDENDPKKTSTQEIPFK